MIVTVEQPSTHMAQSSPSSCRENNILTFFSMPLCLSSYTVWSKELGTITWIIDTGVSDYIICTLHLYTSDVINVASVVALLNRERINFTCEGIVRISLALVFNNVICVPSFKFNLISAKRLAKDSTCCLVFSF